MSDSGLPSFGTSDGHEPTQGRASIERTASGKVSYKITVGIEDAPEKVKALRERTVREFMAFECDVLQYESERVSILAAIRKEG